MGNGAVKGRSGDRSVITSPFVGIEVPVSDIITYLSDTFNEKAREIALIDAWTDEKITYGEVWEYAHNVATNLLKHDFEAGSCLAVCCLNTMDLVPVLLGVWRLGGHVCLVNPLESVELIRRSFQISKAKLVMGHVDYLYKIADAWAGTEIQAVVMKRGQEYNNCVDIEDLFCAPDEEQVRTTRDVFVRPKSSVRNHAVAAIVFTGGVVGEPKAVEITNRGLVYSAFSFSHSAIHRPPKYTILYENVSHMFALGVLLGSLKSGSTCILMKRYDLDVYFQTVVKYKVDTLHLIPPNGKIFSQQGLEIKGNLSFVKEVLYYSEGSPLSKLVEEQISKKIRSNLHIRQFYGMTETSGPVCMVPSKHVKKPTEPGSSGFVIPGWEIIVVSMISGDIAPVGERGEICVKGPYLMKGYRQEKMDSDKVAVFDSKGWLHTGDYGYCTPNGEVHVLCRLEDVIKYQALDVIPTELESILLTCPLGVFAAGVVGFPDRNTNQIPMAWVIKNPDTVGTNVEIELWMAERVPDHKQVRGGVKLVNVMPYSMGGKVLRKFIKKEELATRMVSKSSKPLVRSDTVKAMKIKDKDKLPKEE